MMSGQGDCLEPTTRPPAPPGVPDCPGNKVWYKYMFHKVKIFLGPGSSYSFFCDPFILYKCIKSCTCRLKSVLDDVIHGSRLVNRKEDNVGNIKKNMVHLV